MCEDVDLGAGPATSKDDATHDDERLLKRVQIKVEHGTALVDPEPQPDSDLSQQQETHTATHYISAGEEVIIHQDRHNIPHAHRSDGTIEAAVSMTHDPLSASGGLGNTSITSTPILEDGTQQQAATAHTTIVGYDFFFFFFFLSIFSCSLNCYCRFFFIIIIIIIIYILRILLIYIYFKLC